MNAHNLKLWEMARFAEGISLSGNWQFVTHHPLLFAMTVLRTSRFHAFEYLDNFVSTIGWLAASIPGVGRNRLFGAALDRGFYPNTACSLPRVAKNSFTCGRSRRNGRRLYHALGFETPTVYVQQYVLRGIGHVPGVQGRYFIPFALPLCLLLSNSRLRLSSRWIAGFAFLAICVGSGAAWITIRRTYYEPDAPAQV